MFRSMYEAHKKEHFYGFINFYLGDYKFNGKSIEVD